METLVLSQSPRNPKRLTESTLSKVTASQEKPKTKKEETVEEINYEAVKSESLQEVLKEINLRMLSSSSQP